MASSDTLVLGKLGKTFQLEGGLRFYPLGPAEAEAIFQLDSLILEGHGKSDIRKVRQVGSNIVVYLSRALNVETAKSLVNLEVSVLAESLPPLFESQYFLDDLVAKPVYLEGELYGEVERIISASLQDVLVVAVAGENVMFPLQAPYVAVEDDGIYLSSVPEGLLTLNTR